MTIKPQNTAISRKKPSAPAKAFANFVLKNLSPADKDLFENFNILDFGCGRGADVLWLREQGFKVQGYDPNPAFGFPQLDPGGEKFKFIMLTYVVNTIPTLENRRAAVKEAWDFLTPGGSIMITSRNRQVITNEAFKGNWKPFNDGFLSSESRKTFQKGHNREELRRLFEGLPKVQDLKHLDFGKIRDAAYIILRKEANFNPNAKKVDLYVYDKRR